MSRTTNAVRLPAEMPREPADTNQVSVRIPNGWIAQLDVLASKMSRPGIELARADVLRAAIARGIEELEKEFARPVVPPAPSSRADAKKK